MRVEARTARVWTILFVAAAAFGALTLFAEGVHAEDPSPLIVFESNRDGDFDIFVMDPANELGGAFTIHRLTDHVSDQFEPTWSPDGTRIAYESEQDGDLEIWVMDADGRNKTQLTHNTSSDIEPAWSPDGSMIAYASDVFGSPNAYDIVVMPVNDPDAVSRVTFDPALDMWPTWSPDGKHLAFKSTRDGNWEIYRVELPGEVLNTPVNLTKNPAADQNPDWSPDGSRIAFDSDRNVNPNIWIMNADGSSPVWTSGLFGSDREPNWSPDGQQIAFTSNRGSGQDEIWVLTPNGSLFESASGPALSYEIHQAPDWQPAVDSDDDGLWDSWERYGLWEGGQFLDLPAMGADPLHKDIFVEVDYMDCATGTPEASDVACAADPNHAETPMSRSISEVVGSFNLSGVSNPDGSTGIHLHVDYGETSPLTWGAAATWGDLTEGGSIPHDPSPVISVNASNVWDWSAFDALKGVHFNPERARVFHYSIWAHLVGSSWDTERAASGISRNPDSDFFSGASDFALGFRWMATVWGGWPADAEAKSQAGTFMHELGHNLGLGHGGDEAEVNNKPNYRSVMNYLFQHDGVPFLGTGGWEWNIDYSHTDLPDLDEAALDETKGIGAGVLKGTRFWSKQLKPCVPPVVGCLIFEPEIFDALPADTVDWDRFFGVKGVVKNIDINNSGSFEKLHGYDDWEHIVFTGGTVGAGDVAAVGLPAANSYVEMTPEQFTTFYAPPTSAEVMSTSGLVDPSTGQWHLRDSTGAITSFYFGNPGDLPFMGDWDCDGDVTPGLFRQSDAFVYLSNANTSQVADIRFFFGNPGDIPIAGDFNGDGCDTVSIYRPSEGRFFIINKLGQDEGGLGAAETDYYFGDPGDKPFVGDFNGNGVDTVGLHRESTGLVYFRQTHTQGPADHQFIFGDPGDRLVAGDWGIVDGVDTPALFRPSTTTYYFRHTNTQGPADSQSIFGQSTWLPVAGSFGLG